MVKLPSTRIFVLLTLLVVSAFAQPVPHIRATKTLTCSISQGTPDWSTQDLHGPIVLFDLELCHAVAIGIAGPQAKVLPLPFPDESSALAAVLAGKADLAPTASLDLTNSTKPGLFTGPPILYDGTGLLVPTSIPNAQSLAGKKVCFFAETETEAILRNWFKTNHIDIIPYPFSEEGEMQAAFMTGNCAAIAADKTRLADLRATIGSSATHYKILPNTLAPDPLGPAAADPTLLRIATWVFQLLLNADALGITRVTLPAALTSQDPSIRRLLGRTHELGLGLSPALALDDAWPIHVLTGVGSYSDLITRTLAPTVGPLPVPPALPLK